MTYQPLEFTGERMVPESTDPVTFWEHIYRYKFATHFVKGKRVLDIACGEGYGTAALAKAGAASVVGVDISADTCNHARVKYGVDARVGDAQHIPLPDHSVDVIVSFETVEHVSSPDTFLKECTRVLAPGGTLIVSTPNQEAYTYGDATETNPYHCSEMSEQEFTGLLSAHWKNTRLYAQNLQSVAWWSLRALGAHNPSWAGVRGLGRIYRTIHAVRQAVCPHVLGDVGSQDKHNPVAAILAADTVLANIFNPYAVRKHASSSSGVPVYFVAVASNS